MSHLASLSSRRRAVVAAGLATVIAVGIMGGLRLFRSSAAVLVPVYEIEAESNGRKATLANLGIAPVGVVAVPTPVDVDGDRVADIVVSVNLVDVPGTLSDPLSTNPEVLANRLIAPNVEILRAPEAVAAGKPSPPLKVQVKLTVRDESNLMAAQVIRFGYDTGNDGRAPQHGSIPQSFKAVLRGIENFFNPLSAEVTTRGYEGPIDLVSSVGEENGISKSEHVDLFGVVRASVSTRVFVGSDDGKDSASALRLAYRPFPGRVGVVYGNGKDVERGPDGSFPTKPGQHILYQHDRLDEVDLDTAVALVAKDGRTVSLSDVNARVDRLSRRIKLDLETGNRSGRVAYTSKTDGRLSDVKLDATGQKLRIASDGGLVPIEAPLVAAVDVEGLPSSLEGNWAFPAGGPASADFSSSGQGVGAIGVDVRDFLGQPNKLVTIPEQQQFLAFRTAPGGAFGKESRIQGWVEGIRELSFVEDPQGAQGFDFNAKVGDGEQPLGLYFFEDDRGSGGKLVDARAVVSPLPDDITVRLRKAGQDQRTAPLRITYDAAQAVDVDSRIEVREPQAEQRCGLRGTLCADLKVRHIPPRMEARIAQLGGGNVGSETRIDIEAAPAAAAAKPDLFLDVQAGQPDNIPLVAHGELRGFPRHVSIRAVEGADETLGRAEVHACRRTWDASTPTCQAGTKEAVGLVSFFVRNFLDRPVDLPPATPATPLYATITARGVPERTDLVLFEGTGRFTDIAEVQYRNTGQTFAVRSEVGGGKDLSTLVDLRNIDFQGDDPANGRVDVIGDATISPLPPKLDFCVRQAHQPPETPTDDFAVPCQQSNPFGDGPLATSPLSVAYRATFPQASPPPVRVFGKAAITQRGPLNDNASDDHLLRARLDVENLPPSLTAHVQLPKPGEKGPIRARYEAPLPSPAASQINVDFTAEETYSDLVCQDPRVPAVGQQAMCVKGRIENVPTSATFFFNPTQATDNLTVRTTGGKLMDLRNVEFSQVKRSAQVADRAEVLVATGHVLRVPQSVTGTLQLPPPRPEGSAGKQPVVVDLRADPPLGEVDATVRNFIAPDPIPDDPPARNVKATPGPIHQHVSFVQRGEAFRAKATIRDVQRAAYRTVRGTDATGKKVALDTSVIGVRFGKDSSARAYLDLIGDPASPTSRVLADVVLEEIPAGIDACFRGAKTTPIAPDPGEGTFCDDGSKVEDAEGAFQMQAESADPSKATGMDVDAFFRMTSGGGGTILAARANVENIPFVVQGTLPAAGQGDLDVAGFRKVANALQPVGIGEIGFEAATFDFDATGWAPGQQPFSPKPSVNAVFPAKAPPAVARQFLHGALSGPDFHFRGRIGLPTGPSSRLQNLRFSPRPCPAPSASTPDYPHFPRDGGVSDYACVKAAFDSDAGDPLDIDLKKLDEGEVLTLRDAGLTDVPDWIQATIASTQEYVDPEGARLWRRPCGRASAEAADAVDCMPPLIRFDQPTNSTLFGVLEMGRLTDLPKLGSVAPALQLANLDALPIAGPGPDDGWGSWGSNPRGVRLKVLTFGSKTDTKADDRSAVRAGIRLPLPRSLTLHQFQDFESGDIPKAVENGEEVKLPGSKAKDLRLHYAVRDGSGNPVNSLGELSALVHDVDENTQVLVSDRCATTTVSEGATSRPTTCTGFGRGLSIPGELGVQLYTRENVSEVSIDDDVHRRESQFFQVDARMSSPLNATVRMVSGDGPAGGGKDDIGIVEAAIRNTPTGTAGPGTNPLEPSMRLRAEIIKEKNLEADDVVEFQTLEENIKVNTLYADLNFAPNASKPARQLDAVIYLNKTKQGADLAGYTTVGGGTAAPVAVVGAIDIDPLSVKVKSVYDLPFDDLASLVRQALSDCCGLIGTVVGEILGFVLDVVDAALDYLLNHFPIMITIDAGLLAQFSLNADRFTLRNNIIHAKANVQGGTARLGPINFEARNFYGGVNFYKEIDIPWPLDWIPGVPDAIVIDVPLVGVQYLPGLLPSDSLLPPHIPAPPGAGELRDLLNTNTWLQFRDCGFFESLAPFPIGVQNAVDISGSKDFLIYPLADPRYQLFGVILAVTGGATPLFDAFVDLVAGPIFCNAVDADKNFQAINYSSDAATYNPGNVAASSNPAIGGFGGHPVPGQPNAPAILPEAPPALPPVVNPTPPPPTSVPAGPPAPPAPPAPLFSGPNVIIGSPMSLCGTHIFDEVKINSTVTVATMVNTANPFGTGHACPTGKQGTLRLLANRIFVNGSVVANGIATANPSFPADAPAVAFATGNAGGGHGGPGGKGSDGVGGHAYGADQPAGGGSDQGFSPATAEAASFGGAPGAGASPGAGGGAIVLVGDQFVEVSGTVSANGTPGGSNAGAGACDNSSGDGDADPPYEHTGAKGSGGGSGGGVVIGGRSVDLRSGAKVEARGGAGGAGKLGAGGGGGGGVVKIVSPVPRGLGAVDVSGGDPGDNSVTCAGIAHAAGGGVGKTVIGDKPVSQLLELPEFWHPGVATGTGVPAIDFWVASSALDAASKGVSVAVCGLPKSVATGPPDPFLLTPQFTMPTNQPTPSAPCGSGGVTPVVLGSATRSVEQLQPPNPLAKLSFAPPATSQYLGLYTVALRPQTAGNNCLVTGDGGGVNDATDCKVESLPPAVDQVIGVDADRPTAAIVSPVGGTTFTSEFISLQLSGGDQANLSGLDRRECRSKRLVTDNPPWEPCTATNPSFQLRGGEGTNIIEARAFDRAGNVSSPVASVTVLLDLAAPQATASINAPDGSNGWHRTPPTITISGYTDSAGSPPGSNPYAYRFDNGAEHLCPSPPTPPASPVCTVGTTVTQLLEPGAHTFHFTAIDNAGHRLFDDRSPSPMQRITPGQPADLKYDRVPPTSALLTAPRAPDGANGWFTRRPFVALSAIDQFGASGLTPGPGETPGAGVFYRVNTDGSPPGTVTKYAGPFQLPPGVHTVCWRAVDVAGNEETERCTPDPIKVDAAAPVAVAAPNPAVPNGANGWYVTSPTAVINASDPTPGSGVNPAFAPGLSDLCAGRLPLPNPSPSGTCVSVNGSPFRPYTSAMNISEGVHELRWFAVDVSGQRSSVQIATFRVDRSRPVTAVRAVPPDPARAQWFRRIPSVVLRATDGEQNAGVSTIRYAIDNANPASFSDYLSPFQVPSGEHTVFFHSLDLSGAANAEPVRRFDVAVDLKPPTVAAGSPDPVVWTRELGPDRAKLAWSVGDDLSGPVRIVVFVHDATGRLVARLDGGTHAVTPGATLNGHTNWDGKDHLRVNATVAVPVPAGLYYYRVLAIDEAGNSAQSGESKPLQIKAL